MSSILEFQATTQREAQLLRRIRELEAQLRLSCVFPPDWPIRNGTKMATVLNALLTRESISHDSLANLVEANHPSDEPMLPLHLSNIIRHLRRRLVGFDLPIKSVYNTGFYIPEPQRSCMLRQLRGGQREQT